MLFYKLGSVKLMQLWIPQLPRLVHNLEVRHRSKEHNEVQKQISNLHAMYQHRKTVMVSIADRRSFFFFTFTIVIAAEIGSLTPKIVQTSELSEPAGIMPIGIEIASFWLSLLSKPFRTCTIV